MVAYKSLWSCLLEHSSKSLVREVGGALLCYRSSFDMTSPLLVKRGKRLQRVLLCAFFRCYDGRNRTTLDNSGSLAK